MKTRTISLCTTKLRLLSPRLLLPRLLLPRLSSPRVPSLPYRLILMVMFVIVAGGCASFTPNAEELESQLPEQRTDAIVQVKFVTDLQPGGWFKVKEDLLQQRTMEELGRIARVTTSEIPGKDHLEATFSVDDTGNAAASFGLLIVAVVSGVTYIDRPEYLLELELTDPAKGIVTMEVMPVVGHQRGFIPIPYFGGMIVGISCEHQMSAQSREVIPRACAVLLARALDAHPEMKLRGASLTLSELGLPPPSFRGRLQADQFLGTPCWWFLSRSMDSCVAELYREHPERGAKPAERILVARRVASGPWEPVSHYRITPDRSVVRVEAVVEKGQPVRVQWSEVKEPPLEDVLVAEESSLADAQTRNMVLVVAKNRTLPGILRSRRTEALRGLIDRMEQLILLLNRKLEAARDRAQQAIASGGQPKEDLDWAAVYRERIVLLKAVLAETKEEVANRSR
jgi:hypothetical protein